SRRDDHICVHIISVFEYSAFCLHCSLPPYNPSSSGAEIFPVTALAAATAGLARYTSESTWPIRPTKFRLVVEIHLSPSARIPIYPPRHGPQVGVDTTAPASIKIFSSPSSSACR